MHKTLVIQSHRMPLPYHWIGRCLDSVRDWCTMNKYEYRFIGDELFDCVPQELLDKTHNQRVVATDLARLLTLQNALNNGYQTVIWMDADFLIFNTSQFSIPDLPYAVGREVWVQERVQERVEEGVQESVQYNKQGKLKVYKKVHNAFLMFRQSNNFLDFYADTARRLLTLNNGAMPPQFIGPKLLTALHNVVILPVMEIAGMLSPMVIKDIIQGEGRALELFIDNSSHPIAAANLCASSCQSNEVTDKEMEQVIDVLKNRFIPMIQDT